MSLNNKRLLLLRNEDDIPSLAEAVRVRGGVPVACPVICIRPPEDTRTLDEAIKNLKQIDWIVFTSAHAAKFLIQRVEELNIDRSVFGSIRLAAIGPATASELEEQQLDVEFQAARANAAEFVEEFTTKRNLHGARVLLPLSDIAMRTMPDGLASAGAYVVEAVAYRNAAPQSLPNEARGFLQSNQIDWALFSSPSTVKNLFQLLHQEHIAATFHTASIGPSTSATLREIGVTPDVEADPHTFDGLLDAIGEFKG